MNDLYIRILNLRQLIARVRPSSLLEAFLGLLWLIALPLWLLISSYYSRGIVSLFSHKSGDGWCEPTYQGLGNHCFSDIWVAFYAMKEPNPWSTELPIGPFPYSAISMYPFVFFGWITDVLGTRSIAIFLILGVMAISLLSPAVLVMKSWTAKQFWIPLLFLGLATMPVLQNLDRGNSTSLMIPILAWFTIAFFKNNWRQVSLAIVILACLKIHFLLLGLVLIFARKFLLGILTIIATFGLTVAAFWLWPGSVKLFLTSWASNLTSYGNYGGPDVFYPVNYSAQRAVRLLQIKLTEFFGPLPNSIDATFNNLVANSFLIGGILVVIVLIVGIVTGKKLDKSSALIMVLPLLMVVPGTSWFYYGAIILIIAAAIFRDPKYWQFPWSKRKFSEITLQAPTGMMDHWRGKRTLLVYIIIFAVGVTLVPIPAIPKGWNSTPELYPTETGLFIPYIGGIWTLVILLVAFVSLFSFIRAKQLN